MKFDLKLLPKKQRISLPDLQMDRSWGKELKKIWLAWRQAEHSALPRQPVPQPVVVEWQCLKPLPGEELEDRTATKDNDAHMKTGGPLPRIRQTGQSFDMGNVTRMLRTDNEHP